MIHQPMIWILYPSSCQTRNSRVPRKSLREKCPNTEFFLVRIFLYSDQKRLRIWTLFTQWRLWRIYWNNNTFLSTALISIITGKPSGTISEILINNFYLKAKFSKLKCFRIAILSMTSDKRFFFYKGLPL